MSTTIITKHSNVAKDPQPDDIQRAEIAIDLQRRKIFTKDNADQVIELGGSPDADNYGHWKLQVDYGTPYQVVSGATANFEGINGIKVTRTGDTITIDGSELDLDEEADNYQYWQYKVDGFNTTNVLSTQLLDFQSGDGIEVTKEGYGIKISATGGGGGGSAVHIGANPPASPEEGQQWMEVPASGDATMWIYDGGKWLQHPSGKDGAPGADGNIADATEQGVIATWDDTAGQWTPEGGVVVSGGNVGIGTDNPVSALQVSNNGNEGYEVRPVGIDNAPLHLNFNRSNASYLKQTVRAAEYDWQYPNPSGGSPISAMRIDASGNVGIGYHDPQAFLHLYSPDSTILLQGDGADTRGQISFLGRDSANRAHRQNILSEDAALVIETGGIQSNGYTATERMRIDGDGRVDITGSLYVNGNPKIGTSELIETLATLREATKDETTIKGLRDAIGNAVGGLIEKFEAMQSTATQEIADE